MAFGEKLKAFLGTAEKAGDVETLARTGKVGATYAQETYRGKAVKSEKGTVIRERAEIVSIKDGIVTIKFRITLVLGIVGNDQSATLKFLRKTGKEMPDPARKKITLAEFREAALKSIKRAEEMH